MRPSDGELVKLAAAGDVAAFGQLVERHRGPLLDLARRLSGDRELAADLAQDSLIAAFSQLNDLRDGSKFGAWLASMVRLSASSRATPSAGSDTRRSWP